MSYCCWGCWDEEDSEGCGVGVYWAFFRCGRCDLGKCDDSLVV